MHILSERRRPEKVKNFRNILCFMIMKQNLNVLDQVHSLEYRTEDRFYLNQVKLANIMALHRCGDSPVWNLKACLLGYEDAETTMTTHKHQF